MTRNFFSPEERALLDNARPSERLVIRDLFELLDARLVSEPAAIRPAIETGAIVAAAPTGEPSSPSPTSLPLFDEDAA